MGPQGCSTRPVEGRLIRTRSPADVEIRARLRGACARVGVSRKQAPIHYHERHSGFARTTDTRAPVAGATVIRIRLGENIADPAVGEILAFGRVLDLPEGRFERHVRRRTEQAPESFAALGIKLELLARSRPRRGRQPLHVCADAAARGPLERLLPQGHRVTFSHRSAARSGGGTAGSARRRSDSALASASAARVNSPSAFGLVRFFDHIVDTSTVTRAKTDPGIFQCAAVALGADPAGCLGASRSSDDQVRGHGCPRHW